MKDHHVGTCGNCGGRVTVHKGAWMGINPPVPTCESCGATVAQPNLPVLPMTPSPFRPGIRRGMPSIDIGGPVETSLTFPENFGMHYQAGGKATYRMGDF